MYADRARELRQPLQRLLDVPLLHCHQVRELVDYEHDIRQGFFILPGFYVPVLFYVFIELVGLFIVNFYILRALFGQDVVPAFHFRHKPAEHVCRVP